MKLANRSITECIKKQVKSVKMNIYVNHCESIFQKIFSSVLILLVFSRIRAWKRMFSATPPPSAYPRRPEGHRRTQKDTTVLWLRLKPTLAMKTFHTFPHHTLVQVILLKYFKSYQSHDFQINRCSLSWVILIRRVLMVLGQHRFFVKSLRHTSRRRPSNGLLHWQFLVKWMSGRWRLTCSLADGKSTCKLFERSLLCHLVM